MTGVFLQVINLSLVGSWVILLVLLVRIALRKSPKWCSYLLWGVVFVRLIIPVFPEMRFSLIPAKVQTSVESLLEGVVEANESDFTVFDQGGDKADVPEQIEGLEKPMQDIEQVQGGENSIKDTIRPNSEEQGWEFITRALTLITYFWLAGVIGFGSYHIQSYYKFKKQVRGAVLKEDGTYEIQGGHLSFVLGIFKPEIYLSSELDEDSRKVVLCHEQVHLARKDYIFKPLALAISCVHWFNPLVWLAFYCLNKDCEMSCDEKVVSLLGEDSKKIYSYTLLDESTRGERLKHKHENTCAVLSFGEDSIKTRIQHVLHYKKASVWIVGSTVIVLIVLTVGLLSNHGKEERYETLFATACRALNYVQEDEEFYLTVLLEEGDQRGSKVAVRVDAPELLELLSVTELGEVDGVQIALRISKEILEKSEFYQGERKIDGILYPERVDVFGMLCDESYQSYFTLSSIYWKESRDADETTITTGGIEYEGKNWTRYSDGMIFQVGNGGIYQVVGEEMICIYPYYLPEDANLSFKGDILYFPANSERPVDDTNWVYDSVCELNAVSGECRYILFQEEDKSRYNMDDLWIHDGFIFRSTSVGGGKNQAIALADAKAVWNDRTTAELSAEEQDTYGAYMREYLLGHPNEMVMVGNRYWDYTEAVIDMDGDGKAEQISITPVSERGQYYPYDEYNLQVDDWVEKRYSNRLSNAIWAFSPDGAHIFLALYEDGPSADPRTTFFRYEDGKLVESGRAGNYIDNIKMEDGILHVCQGVDVIQTDAIWVKYAFGTEGFLEVIPQETYEFTLKNELTLRKELVLHKEPGSAETFILQHQSVQITLVSGDFKWVYVKAADGQGGWLEMADGVYKIYDGQEAHEYFDGLYYAG